MSLFAILWAFAVGLLAGAGLLVLALAMFGRALRRNFDEAWEWEDDGEGGRG